MSKTSLFDSTASPETSFGGQLLSDSETLSSLIPWVDDDEDAADTWLSFHADVTSPRGAISFGSQVEGLEALKRAIALFVISRLPENGLDEALASLRDIWDSRVPSEMTSLPREITQTVQGRIRSVSERAFLDIED